MSLTSEQMDAVRHRVDQQMLLKYNGMVNRERLIDIGLEVRRFFLAKGYPQESLRQFLLGYLNSVADRKRFSSINSL
jgi:hypothetical protein